MIPYASKKFYKFVLAYVTCVCLSILSLHSMTNEEEQEFTIHQKKPIAVIVDPFSSGSLIAPKLKEHGVDSISVLSSDNLPSFLLATYQKNNFLEEFLFEGKIEDEQGMNKLIISLSNYNVHAVFPGTETGVLLADYLSSKLTNSSNDLSKSSARRNKFEMQKALEKNNVLFIPSFVLNDIETMEGIVKQYESNEFFGSGFIVKPIQSAGTDGVKFCNNVSEVIEATEKLLGTKDALGGVNNEVLLQPFVVGEEYVVDAVSINGQHIITDICKYNKTKTNDGNILYNHLDFIENDDPVAKELIDYTKLAITSLGIKYGPSHNEIMYTNLGPVLIESGARMHGGGNPMYCFACMGNSQLEMLPKVYFSSFVEDDNLLNYQYNLIKKGRDVFLQAPYSSTLHNVSEFKDKVYQLKTFFTCSLHLDVETMPQTCDLLTSPGHIVLVGDQIQDIEHDTQLIRLYEVDLYKAL